MSAAPLFVLVGGVNGAGKSTFAQDKKTLGEFVELDSREVEFINPDLVTRALIAQHPQLTVSEANLRAAVESEAQVDRLIREAKRSFVIETVLSTDKYEARIVEALKRGFDVLFVYVLLESVKQSVERVAIRVANGGHDVPLKKIRERWERSRTRLPKYFELASRALVFINWPLPQLLAEKDGYYVRFHRDPPKSLAPILKHLRPAWLHGA